MSASSLLTEFMMSSSITEYVIGSIVISLIYLLLKYPSTAIGTVSRKDLPGPRGLPLVGNMFQAMAKIEYLPEWMLAHRLQYGLGSSITLVGRRMTDVSSPDQLEYIQKTNFSNYVKGNFQTDMMRDALGFGIFAADGHNWSSSRKTMANIFTANSFAGIITDSIETSLVHLESILTKRSKSRVEFDLQALFFAFTLSSFVKLGFGQDIGCLTSETDVQVPFAEAFDFAQWQMMNRFTNPLWKVTEAFSGDGRKMRHAVKTMNDFAYSIIDGREKTVAGEKPKDLLGLLMNIRDEKGQPISRQGLRDNVLNAIIAGRDTSAQALSWTFFRLLSSDPSLLAKLKEEVDRLGECTYESYKDFVQVTAAFNEGLRLHPSVPKNTWMALDDDQIPNGPKIQKGDWVRWSDWQMARDPDIWGADCAEFKPSRWIDEKGELVRHSHYKYHVFNGGARLCLGMNLAIFESVSVMVTILRNYDLNFAPNYLSTVEMCSVIAEEKTPQYAMSLTLPMKEPLRVVVSQRKL